MTSPAVVVILAELGKTMAVEAVRTQEAANRHSRIRPETAVPNELIVADPVIWTDSPSAVLRSVVEAAEIDALARALVLRRMA